MSTKQVEITICDLCGKDLGAVKSSVTLRMIYGGGLCQAWPLKTGEIGHVCTACCYVLEKAKRLGIAEYSMERLVKGV